MSIAIEATNLGKRYVMRGLAPPTLFGKLKGSLQRKPPDYFWALKDVSFKIKKGQTVGVVGPNGSGKSSLLGLVTGTIYPTQGNVRTDGRISSLLELGAGFHPDLTGRENVYLNAAILGIPREDIHKRMDHIIDFSGLHQFIDMPVKHYSSGMYVRLGFAVAVEMKPDILLIDEVLAVGDIAFQLKCLDRIRTFQREGKTLLLVSHALQTVEEFCDEALLIHKGNLIDQGEPQDTILKYIRSYMGEGGYLFTQEFGTKDVELGDVRFIDAAGKESSGTLNSGEAVTIEIEYDAKKRIESPVFGFSLKTGNGFYVYGNNTQNENMVIDAIEGRGKISFQLDPLQLMSGNFFLSLSVHSQDHATQYHRREDWYPFAVKNALPDEGIFRCNAQWDQPTEA